MNERTNKWMKKQEESWRKQSLTSGIPSNTPYVSFLYPLLFFHFHSLRLFILRTPATIVVKKVVNNSVNYPL
jgi:hypothetical protein